jgi:hypothetical protein
MLLSSPLLKVVEFESLNRTIFGHGVLCNAFVKALAQCCPPSWPNHGSLMVPGCLAGVNHAVDAGRLEY